MMKPNEGTSDRIIRFVIGAAVAMMGLMYALTGIVAIAVFGIAAVLMLTAAIGICPLYSVFGVNTCSLKKS